VGYEDLSKRRNFHLNEKSIEKLESAFLVKGKVFAAASSGSHCTGYRATA